MRTVVISLSLVSGAGSALATTRTGIGAPTSAEACNLTTYVSKNRPTGCISQSYGFPANYLSASPEILNGTVVITPHLALRWFVVDLVFWSIPSFGVIWGSALLGNVVMHKLRRRIKPLQFHH
jgi:hypothetical protein